jgi:hypothetical protein
MTPKNAVFTMRHTRTLENARDFLNILYTKPATMAALGTAVFFPGGSGRGMTVTTHLDYNTDVNDTCTSASIPCVFWRDVYASSVATVCLARHRQLHTFNSYFRSTKTFPYDRIRFYFPLYRKKN